MLLSPLETLFYPAVCCTLPNYSSEEDDCSIESWEWWSEILSRNFSSKYIILVFVTEWAVRHFTARELPLTGTQHLSCVPHKAHFMETVSMFVHSKQECLHSRYLPISSEFLTGSWVERGFCKSSCQIFRDWLYRSWIIQALFPHPPYHLLAFLLLISTSTRDLGLGRNEWVWNSHQTFWLLASSSWRFCWEE